MFMLYKLIKEKFSLKKTKQNKKKTNVTKLADQVRLVVIIYKKILILLMKCIKIFYCLEQIH